MSHPVCSMVLTVQATMFLAFPRVLTVWATLLSMMLLFKPPLLLVLSRVLAFLGHPIFYGANCSTHHVISLSQMLIVWATLFRPVITVQATMLLLVMRASATPFWWCQLLEPLWYSFPQRWSMFWALQYYLFHCRFIIIIRSSS